MCLAARLELPEGLHSFVIQTVKYDVGGEGSGVGGETETEEGSCSLKCNKLNAVFTLAPGVQLNGKSSGSKISLWSGVNFS